jgi:hypothetical protein
MEVPVKPEEVPDDLTNAGRNALALYYRRIPRHTIPTLEDRVRVVLAAVLPAAHRQWFKDLFLHGDPEERRRARGPARPDRREDIMALLGGVVVARRGDVNTLWSWASQALDELPDAKEMDPAVRERARAALDRLYALLETPQPAPENSVIAARPVENGDPHA